MISEDELIIDAVNYRFESRRDHHFKGLIFTNINNTKSLMLILFPYNIYFHTSLKNKNQFSPSTFSIRFVDHPARFIADTKF